MDLESKSHIDCQARPCQFGLSDMIFAVIFVHLIIKCLHDCFIIVVLLSYTIINITIIYLIRQF